MLAALFIFMFFYIPEGWIMLNYLLPMVCMHEYSLLQSCILENILSRFPDQKALHYRLIQKLNQEWFSLLTMTLYHINILFCPIKYNGLVVLSLFIIVVYEKLYIVNSFIQEMHCLVNDYKKDPEKTQT